MANSEAMTSSTRSFAYSYRLVKKCFVKICETSKCHNFLIFQPIFIRFSLFCSENFTLSSEIMLNLFRSSPLRVMTSQGFIWIPMSPSLCGNSARICDATREQFSIDFVHGFPQLFIFLGYQYTSLSSLITKCLHNYLSPNMPKYKSIGKILMKSENLWSLCTVPLENYMYTVVTSHTDFSRVPPEAYMNSVNPLKKQSSWLDYPKLPKLLLVGLWNDFSFTHSA